MRAPESKHYARGGIAVKDAAVSQYKHTIYRRVAGLGRSVGGLADGHALRRVETLVRVLLPCKFF